MESNNSSHLCDSCLKKVICQTRVPRKPLLKCRGYIRKVK